MVGRSDDDRPHPINEAITETTSQGGKRVEEGLRDLRLGYVGTLGDVTLTINVASTTVTLYGCSSTSLVALVPLTAHAAAEIATGNCYVVPAKGSFTINHTNNAVADRKFRYVMHWGKK
jgi:hypothetical protein